MLTRPPVASRATRVAASPGLSGQSSVGASGVCRPAHASPVSSNGSLQRKASMDTGMQRQFSGSVPKVSLQRRSSTQTHALGAVAEVGETSSQGILKVLTDPGAASASFDDVCEMFGDVAKLDNVSATLTASLGAGQAVKGVLNNNAALGWLVEKATQNLHQFSLLEGLIDKTLLDLFQQLYSALDLTGDVMNMPSVRLAVAAAIALAVRHLVSQYQQQHGAAKLKRQLSPAASLSDALAETAAAAIIANSVKTTGDSSSNNSFEDKQQHTQPVPAYAAVSTLPASTSSSAGGFSSAFAACAAAMDSVDDSNASTMPSFKDITTSILQDKQLSPTDKARVAAGSLLTSMLLGQFKRANKLKRKVRSSFAEVAKGRWSPAMLVVLIEAGVFVHNYSELAQGVETLLHIAS